MADEIITIKYQTWASNPDWPNALADLNITTRIKDLRSGWASDDRLVRGRAVMVRRTKETHFQAGRNPLFFAACPGADCVCHL